jgi:hypothetical protein
VDGLTAGVARSATPGNPGQQWAHSNATNSIVSDLTFAVVGGLIARLLGSRR